MGRPCIFGTSISEETEVSAVKYISWEEYKNLLAKEDPEYVPYDVKGKYGLLFDILSTRYKENMDARSLTLQKQIDRYAPIRLDVELSGLTEADKEALVLLLKAAMVIDEIFHLQVWYTNPALRDWLREHINTSNLDKLKWMDYLINKSPWSSLDESQSFLTTADSAVMLLVESTKPLSGWKGLEYRAAFPMLKPPGANFYPSDMDKNEFELWKNSLSDDQEELATGFFNVIRRRSESGLGVNDHKGLEPIKDLYSDSKLDVTIGPYETYEDTLFGYKATFEAFIGVRDDEATSQVKLFGDQLQVLEQNLPLDDLYKSKDVVAAPIRVIQLVYNAGMLKVLKQLLSICRNDERIVKERGTSMELQELHSSLEEAKADIVGLWALRFLIKKVRMLPITLVKSMYVSFLAGCFRIDTLRVRRSPWVEEAVESLSREILTIQAKGDKAAAKLLLEDYGKMTEPMRAALDRLELF
ncbi:hypothetical protein GIB67_030995, partial [Kingdonia uniflora]